MNIENQYITETLCALSHVAQRPSLAPPDLRGTVHMYGTDLRADQIIEELVASATATACSSVAARRPGSAAARMR